MELFGVLNRPRLDIPLWDALRDGQHGPLRGGFVVIGIALGGSLAGTIHLIIQYTL